jgi:micrococcal nuclease
LCKAVYVGEVMVNAELVRQGYAQVATFPPNVTHQDQFLALQREAREARVGCWKIP